MIGFMIKKGLCVLLAMTMILCLAGCAKANQEEISDMPRLLITVGNKKIENTTRTKDWDGTIYDYLGSIFDQVLFKDSDYKMEYVKLGETIQLDLGGGSPDNVVLEDYVLVKDEKRIYKELSKKEIPVAFVNGKFTFMLEPHLIPTTSSGSNTQGKEVFRGFHLSCNWSGNKGEYGFVIKTDSTV
ncbi:MAG: hypothetical protein K0R90_880 [Oscillospiraceae bacterium]|jgi:hypothetical protein|nr:hypothetical protein [Oscillospiraceae bacterium]